MMIQPPAIVLTVALVAAALPPARAQEPRNGFAELIGRVEEWRESEPIKTPWNRNGDQGGYGKKFRGFDRRRNFTFTIKAHKDASIHTLEVKEEDRKPFTIEAGKTVRVYNRPVTTWNWFQCSFSVTDLEVDWTKRPTARVIVAAEANYSSYRPKKDEHPTAISAYLIQIRPEGKDADLPPDHWPVWYVNNWIHFAHTVIPTVHHRTLANHGFNFWSWGVFDPPPNLKGKPSIGTYRVLRHPETGKVSSVVLHTPGACELADATDERLRYSKPPSAKAKASVLSGKAPLKVDFTATATDPDGDRILWMSWDFDGSDGVGADATGPKASHTFTRAGRFVVSLVAMDATGRPGRDHVRIAVTKE